MATTTITAIRTAIEAVVVGLTPANTAYGRAAYRVANKSRAWDERGASDIDREFTIEDIPVGDVLEFGVTSERLHGTTMEVLVGHARMADRHDSMARRDDDITQIADELQSKANFPTGVFLVAPAGSTTTELGEKAWLTTITFRLLWARAI